MPQHYWAVKPKGSQQNIRIERAETAMKAYELAFGRGDPWGHFEAKDLGARVSVIQSDKQRIALLRSLDGWFVLGKPRSAR